LVVEAEEFIQVVQEHLVMLVDLVEDQDRIVMELEVQEHQDKDTLEVTIFMWVQVTNVFAEAEEERVLLEPLEPQELQAMEE
jgi:hypothetical protein